MKLILLPLLACGLWAQDAKVDAAKPPESTKASNPDLDAAKARIAWLEQKLALTEASYGKCFAALNGVFSIETQQLQGLAAKEPKAEPSSVVVH